MFTGVLPRSVDIGGHNRVCATAKWGLPMKMKTVVNVLGAIWVVAAGTANGQSLTDGMDMARQGNFPGAYDVLHPLAKEGDAQAQFNLALLYHSGMGVARNEAEAVRLYLASAEKGFPLAEEYVAVGFEEGWFGLPRDPAQATFWRKKLQDN